MKAKIDLDKFVCSLVERYYEKIHIDHTTTKCWLDSVLEDQGLEYKDGEIVEIEQEQPYNKPLFFEKGKWYTCIAKVDGFKVGHTYQSKMDGTVSNDSGAMYMYHNDANFIFRPATEDEIPHKPPSKPDYEDLSIINEGDDGVLLYFTKDGRGISDFRISKDTARWLHGRLEEYLEMYDDEEPIEEISEDLRKRYERIGKSDWFKKTHEGMSITVPDDLEGTDMDGGVVGEKGEEGEEPQEQDGFEAELNALLKKYEHLPKEELADSLEFYLGVVKEQHKTPFNKKRLEEVAKPETLEEKVGHWQRMRDIAMEKIKGEFKEEDSPETKAIKEQMENLKKRIEDNQLGCIVQRLDKIIELLSWKPSPNIIPYPYTMPITYKRPLDPDPNVLGGWTTTANTEGGEE